MKALVTLVVVLIMPIALRAHEDTLISLEGKALVNLPKRFQPASFDANEASLTIAGKQLLLPRFLKSVLGDPKSYDLILASSWYHDPELLPPYISIKIAPKGRHFTYRVLVDMSGLRVLGVELELKETDSNTDAIPSITRVIPVDPAFWREGKGGRTIETYPSQREIEQAGTDQPATKPADKSHVKDQPSTHNLKDAPR